MVRARNDKNDAVRFGPVGASIISTRILIPDTSLAPGAVFEIERVRGDTGQLATLLLS